jgi:hypothetical protein
MDQLMVTTIVCQAEMFKNAAAQLEAIIDLIPEDQVRYSSCAWVYAWM